MNGMDRIGRMNLDIALAVAAAENDLSREQVASVLADFFDWLVRCPVCGGDGSFTTRHRVQVTVEDPNRPTTMKAMMPEGVESVCPRCGGLGNGGGPKDAEWVREIAPGEWAIVVPLDIAEQVSGAGSGGRSPTG